MKNSHLENVIVGSGLAAMAASLFLLEHNQPFTLVFDHPGATSLYSGAIDLASHSSENVEGVTKQTFQERIASLLQKAEHPYSLIASGLKEDFQSWLSTNLGALTHSFPYLGQNSHPDLKPQLALTFYGHLKETFLLSPSQNLNFLDLNNTKIGIVGFEQLSEFKVDWALKNLTQLHAAFLEERKIVVLGKEFSLKPSGFLTQAAIAAHFDEETPETLMTEIENWVKQEKINCLIFPPVLGIKRHSEIMKELENRLSIKVSECLAFNPSVPGFRLHQAFLARLKHRGVEFKIAQIKDLHIEDQKIISFSCVEEGQLKTYSVGRVLLCTGKYFSGGLNAHQVQPSLLPQIPIYERSQRVALKHFESLTRLKTFQTHSLFSLGLKINSNMQVLREDGEIFAHNLYAAGSILSGYDPMREGCSGGVALLSGIRAAQQWF